MDTGILKGGFSMEANSHLVNLPIFLSPTGMPRVYLFKVTQCKVHFVVMNVSTIGEWGANGTSLYGHLAECSAKCIR